MINKKKTGVFVIILLISFVAFSQEEFKPRETVKIFISYLYSDTTVSINEFHKTYINGSVLTEAGFIQNVLNEKKDVKHMDLFNDLDYGADTIESAILGEMKKYKERLLRGYSVDYIKKQIDKSVVIYEGELDSYLLRLNLDNDYKLYFMMSGPFIFDIWMNNGSSFNGLLWRVKVPEVLKRPAIINDPDGYVNVRKKGAINHPVTGKILKGKVFYYTPIGNSNWYPVYEKETSSIWGYVHKSRILEYKDFPEDIKDKVKKQRSGC